MAIYVKESSTWREINQSYVKTSGVWREITIQSVKDAGTWREVFPPKGELYTWGSDVSGSLGINVSSNTYTTNNKSTPVTTFAGGTNWKQVSLGQRCAAAIKTDGTLWVWGSGSSGVLGTNDTVIRCTPVTTFAGGTNWKQVTCGLFHTAAIKTDGTLWTWGGNSNVVLGTNDNATRCTPVTTFAGGTNWKQVACGGYSVAAIKTDGTLWVWGANGGRLGTNDTAGRCTPVTTFAGGTNWKEVSCTERTMAAIKTDGTLWTWGVNLGGALGTNDTATRCTPVTTFAGGTNWKQLASFSFGRTGLFFPPFMAAIKTDGTLWVWGGNSSGHLGINSAGFGSSISTPVTTFAGGTNWKQVSATSSPEPASVSAIKTDGTLWIWGNNQAAALGINSGGSMRCTPVTTFAGGTNWKQCQTNGDMSSAIR